MNEHCAAHMMVFHGYGFKAPAMWSLGAELPLRQRSSGRTIESFSQPSTSNPASVGFVRVFGGGWDVTQLPKQVEAMLVRSERPEDYATIRLVNEEAFNRPDEADLIDRLRAEGVVLASFIAETEGQIVGHILFCRMSIETATESLPAAALAPVAVLPKLQRQGIGGGLIRYGLDWLRQRDEQIVLVLGHPDYYPRFGFSTEKASFLDSPFNSRSLMALELKPEALQGIQGKLRYPAAFGLGDQFTVAPHNSRTAS